MGGRSSPAPAAPDYVGQARVQGQEQRELDTARNWADRPNVTTPWGSQTWQTSTQIDPSTGKPVTSWNMNIALDPAQQAALDAQNRIGQQRSDVAESLLGRASNSMLSPFDMSQVPAAAATPWGGDAQYASGGPSMEMVGRGPQLDEVGQGPALGLVGFGPRLQTDLAGGNEYFQRGGDALYQQAQSRLDGRFATREADLESKLANMGITRGSEAWNREMSGLATERNDAYNDAAFRAAQFAGQEGSRLQTLDLNAGNFGNQARQQMFGNRMGATAADNQALQQMFGNYLTTTGTNNQTRQQDYDNYLKSANFNNQASQQMFGNELDALRFNDQAQGNQFNRDLMSSNYQNQLRQQAISEQQMMRQMPLNEMNAFLSGQQVNMPQFPGFNRATGSQATDMTGAMNNQYQAQMNQFNYDQQSRNQRDQRYAQYAALAAMFI